MKKILHLFKSGQKGFTLIEIIISIAISSILGFGAAAVLTQMFGENRRATTSMENTQQVESVGYWLTRDALIAQIIEPGASAGFPLRLKWQNWDFDASGNIVNNQIEYSLSGEDLMRTKSINGVTQSQTRVASKIDIASTSCTYSEADQLITLDVTAREGTTTKSYTCQVRPRPDNS
jgi:prepilin-type N-terminal cleavage/methylation domain-containing protein